MSFFYLRSFFAAATPRNEEASGVAVAHGRLSARDGGGEGRRRRRTRTRTRSTRRGGGAFWKAKLVGGVELGTNWLQRKKYKLVYICLLVLLGMQGKSRQARNMTLVMRGGSALFHYRRRQQQQQEVLMLVALLFRLILVWSCSVALLLSCVAAAAAMTLPDEGEKKKKKKKKKKFCSLCFSIFCSVLLC